MWKRRVQQDVTYFSSIAVPGVYSCCRFRSLQLFPALSRRVCQLTASTESIPRQWWAAFAALWLCRCNALQSLLRFLCWIFSDGFSQDEITSKVLLQVWNLREFLPLVVFILSSTKDKVKHFVESKKTSKEKGKVKKKANPLSGDFRFVSAGKSVGFWT